MGFVMFTGGARSGKSTLGLRAAAASGRPVVFVATAEAFDDEMRHRIALHREERPAGWITVEAPVGLGDAIAGAAGEACVIIDCLSLWVSNLMLADVAAAEIESRAIAAADRLAARAGGGVIVTNEVGSGIVPDNALARGYRDMLGRVNAIFSLRAEAAYLTVMGRVLSLDVFDPSPAPCRVPPAP